MANKDIQIKRDNNLISGVSGAFPDVSRMMERFFSDPFSDLLPEMPRISRKMMAEWRETDSAYVLNAEIPGIPREEVEILINGNMLTVRAEHKEEQGTETSEKGYRRQYRSFQQSYSLPTTVDADKIEAHCDNGMLEVLIPKTAASQVRKVEIQSGKGGLWNRLTGKNQEGKQEDKQAEQKH